MKKNSVPKWLRITIPTVLIIIWLLAAMFGGRYFGKISEVSELDLAAFLPNSAESTEVSNIVKKFNDKSTENAILALEKSSGEFSEGEESKISDLASAIESKSGVAEVSPAVVSDDKKAAIIVMGLDSNSDVDTDELLSGIRSEAESAELGATKGYITGGAGFSADLGEAFSGIDGLLLVVALAVVFVILIIVYRSPILPIAVLLTSCFALAAAIFVVYQLASAGYIVINGQVQGILFILVIGAATDYSLLLVARFREELYRTSSRWEAGPKALKGTIEPVLASGGTVIAGLLCLLLSDLESNRALGPAGAVGIVLAMFAALTLLPSILVLLGRNAFWPYRPQASAEEAKKHQKQLKSGIWQRVGAFVEKYPRRIWIGTTIALLIMCVGVFQFKADGMPVSELVLGYSEAREGQQVISDHFPAGQGSPTYVVVQTSDVESIVPKIESDVGVESVSALATGESGMKPLGGYKDKIKEEIQSQIEAQYAERGDASGFAGAPAAPSIESLVERAYPFKDAEVKSIDDRSVLQVTLTSAPDSRQAEETVNRLREIDGTLVGGITATSLDTTETSVRDRAIIIPAILVSITIILMLLLRSILAPILLTITTVISFGSAIGVSAIVFNYVLGLDSADPSVVLYAFVFLVALGIDYNIFLMTRVREEALKIGTRKGVIRGLVVTGGVITSAGIVLASTFAALSVIPIAFLVQLAFIVAFGVLLDTLIVRSLLVPALIRDMGAIVWWPSKLKDKQ